MMTAQYNSEHLTLLTESSKIHTIHYFIHVCHFQNKPHLGGHLGGHLEFLKNLNDVGPIKSLNSVMSSNQSTIKNYNVYTIHIVHK